MAYTLQALIGATKTLSSKDLGGNTVILEEGFELFLFSTAFCEKNSFEILPLSSESSKVLPENINAFCSSASFGCKIAYVEAEYFGGTGTQACVVFENATTEAQPIIDPKAINLALKGLGVKANAPFDEFASLGLGKNRHTDEW